MKMKGQPAGVGFHDGELAVQERAGARSDAARLSGMLDPVELRGGIVAFLAGRSFAVITARDPVGRLWTSPLAGTPGFLDATSSSTLTIRTWPGEGDPLHGLPEGQPAGLIVIEFAARRRVRINGTLTGVRDGELSIEVEQAYGNCPQYIQQRLLVPGAPGQADARDVRRDIALGSDDIELIRSADTFFLGTTHPARGSDASHRGGPAGFVRADGDGLWWPDYPGNNMFNSLGNLAIDPTAALLFPDFSSGRTLQLSGIAAVEWGEPGTPGDDGGTGRGVRFTVERLAAGRLLAASETDHTAYPRDLALTD